MVQFICKMQELPNIILYAIPFFVASIVLEIYVLYKRKQKTYKTKDAFTSISMGIGNVLLGFLTKTIVLIAFFYIYNNFRIFTIPITWWSFVLLLFLVDLSYYWFHRISHECRLFWASHVVHHSSESYNLSTALRQTWSGGFYTFIFWLCNTWNISPI